MSDKFHSDPPEYHSDDTWTGTAAQDEPNYTVVPFENLSTDALYGVIEDVIQREGTDYGLHEVEHNTKIEQILNQLRAGQAVIAFDNNTETVTILHKEQLL